MTPGDYFRLGRYQKGMKITDLAKKLKMSVSTLHAFEVDRRVPTQQQWADIRSVIPLPPQLPK